MLKFGRQITTDTEKTGNDACGNNTFLKIGVVKTENFIRKLHNTLNLGSITNLYNYYYYSSNNSYIVILTSITFP